MRLLTLKRFHKVKCKVVLKKATYKSKACYSLCNRTKKEVEKAIAVLLAGNGIFWQLNKEGVKTMWFWDGLLGWHLNNKEPQVLNNTNWSNFSVAAMDKIYMRIKSPFAKPKTEV